ncbi:hypothetical protein DFJ73DRAFT_814999 [Zopfochytrium polystomum]|nr:hypothetical protein DFJ73DRAFT_814999 [Zopfochytrium polystomum]
MVQVREIHENDGDGYAAGNAEKATFHPASAPRPRTARNRARSQSEAKKGSPSKPMVELSEAEQRRLIKESGVLHKIRDHRKSVATTNSMDDDSDYDDDDDDGGDIPTWLQTVLVVAPLSVLHIVLSYAVHLQFGFADQFTLSTVVSSTGPFTIAFTFLVVLSTHWKAHIATQLILATASVAAGVTLIKLTESQETFGVTLRTPGLAVVWVYTVIQMRLGIAAGSLLVPAVYYFFGAWAVKVAQGGETMRKF